MENLVGNLHPCRVPAVAVPRFLSLTTHSLSPRRTVGPPRASWCLQHRVADGRATPVSRWGTGWPLAVPGVKNGNVRVFDLVAGTCGIIAFSVLCAQGALLLRHERQL